MKRSILFFFIIHLSAMAFSQIRVEDFYRPSDGKDMSKAINRALKILDEQGHGTLEFKGTENYFVADDCELPRYSKSGRRIIIINGNGCKITAADSVNVFNRIPENQKEALNKMMSTRFVFNDLTIVGGKKAINLGATYGSSINRCNFSGQREAAVDIQFGLNTSIFQCNSTGAWKDNFILRTGIDWGGSANNSQSNQSVIDMCRVYARNGAHSSFIILGSGGCVIRDAISEGSSNIDYCVIIDRLNSTTVRLNKIENIHIEHKPLKAGIFIKSSGTTTVDGLFYQLAYPGYALIYAAPGTNLVVLKNIPHFVSGTVIKQEKPGGKPFWRLEYCNRAFKKPEIWQVKNSAGEWEVFKPYSLKVLD